MERCPSIQATEGEGEGPQRAEDDFRFGGWRILGVQGGGYEKGKYRSRPIFGGQRKTRGGEMPDLDKQCQSAKAKG